MLNESTLCFGLLDLLCHSSQLDYLAFFVYFSVFYFTTSLPLLEVFFSLIICCTVSFHHQASLLLLNRPVVSPQIYLPAMKLSLSFSHPPLFPPILILTLFSHFLLKLQFLHLTSTVLSSSHLSSFYCSSFLLPSSRYTSNDVVLKCFFWNNFAVCYLHTPFLLIPPH